MYSNKGFYDITQYVIIKDLKFVQFVLNIR